MSAMQTDLQSGSPAGPLYGESLGNPLGSYLVKRFGVFAPGLEDYKGSLPKPRLNRVREYIEQHLDDNVSLAALADVAGVSLYHFANAFKQSTGATPRQFVLDRKIERAKELLRSQSERARGQRPHRLRGSEPFHKDFPPFGRRHAVYHLAHCEADAKTEIRERCEHHSGTCGSAGRRHKASVLMITKGGLNTVTRSIAIEGNRFDAVAPGGGTHHCTRMFPRNLLQQDSQ